VAEANIGSRREINPGAEREGCKPPPSCRATPPGSSQQTRLSSDTFIFFSSVIKIFGAELIVAQQSAYKSVDR
jgi:hypothetical protein